MVKKPMEDFMGWITLWLLVLETSSFGSYLDGLFHDKIIIQLGNAILTPPQVINRLEDSRNHEVGHGANEQSHDHQHQWHDELHHAG